jgi:hypothetical protein
VRTNKHFSYIYPFVYRKGQQGQNPLFRMKKLILILLVFTASFQPLSAQDTLQSKTRDLVGLIYQMEDLAEIIPFIMQQMHVATLEEEKMVVDVVIGFLTENFYDFLDSLVVVYDEIYTVDEISALHEFYNSTIGKRLLQTQTLLFERTTLAIQQWMMHHMDEIMEKVHVHMSENLPGFDDYYDEDEVFEPDQPYTYEVSGADRKQSFSSSIYPYKVLFNRNEWEIVPNYTVNEVADVTFVSKDQMSFALIIAERDLLDLNQLKAASLFNFNRGLSDVEVHQLNMREINNSKVLYMKVSGKVFAEGELLDITYNNYYFAGYWGALQFISFTASEMNPFRESIMMDLLNGLVMD